MEFVKPKPGLVENLFFISGRHHWFRSPVCWGWGARGGAASSAPWLPIPDSGWRTRIPTVEVSMSFLAGTRCLEAQMGWLHSVVWGTPKPQLGESGLWLICAEPAVCMLS